MLRTIQGKRHPGFGIGLACIVLLATTGVAHAGKVDSFTADQVTMDPQGQIKTSGKYYVAPQKMRMEMPSPENPEKKMIIIVRQDQKVHWMINPTQKVYMERPLNEAEMQQFTQQMIDARDEKILGTESVGGYACTKKQVETSMTIMGYKRKTRSIVWVSDQFDMPLRTQSDDGGISELRNIDIGEPPADVFEPPEGYRKVTNMMEFMAVGMGDADPAETRRPGRIRKNRPNCPSSCQRG